MSNCIVERDFLASCKQHAGLINPKIEAYKSSEK